MHLPKGIDGLKERQEERENEKIALHINNSFLTVQANYIFRKVAAGVCMNPFLQAEPDHDRLFERESSYVHIDTFFHAIVCLSGCLSASPSVSLPLPSSIPIETKLCPECQ